MQTDGYLESNVPQTTIVIEQQALTSSTAYNKIVATTRILILFTCPLRQMNGRFSEFIRQLTCGKDLFHVHDVVIEFTHRVQGGVYIWVVVLIFSFHI